MSNLVDIQSQIEKLQKQASDIKTKEFAATVKEIQAKMQAFGITVKDIQTRKAGFAALAGAMALSSVTAFAAEAPGLFSARIAL